MGHMATNQLTRQFADNPAEIDITGAQMVLVMKLSAFAWNVADGTLPEDQLSDFQKSRRILKLPSLLDYAGYVLFFPSLLTGPAFDYNEYRGWLDCTMFDVPATIDPAKKPPTRKKRKIPRSATPAMWKLASGCIWVYLFLNLIKYYSHEVLLDDQFMKLGLLRRIFTMHMVGFTARTKYYGVWSMAEGSCILAGLGYNGVDPVTGKISWDRLQNINPWGVETAQNSRAYLGNWNMNTNKWLRYYVYLRVTPRNRKPGFRASMATFVTSAFWHGFYPGYYLSFVLASFVQQAAKSTFPSPPHLFICFSIQLVDAFLTHNRLPPHNPPLLPRPSNPKAAPKQKILRLRLLARNTDDLLLRRGTLRHPPLRPIDPRLEPRVLLRRVIDRRQYGVLCFPG